jgi:hypothetical protein
MCVFMRVNGEDNAHDGEGIKYWCLRVIAVVLAIISAVFLRAVHFDVACTPMNNAPIFLLFLLHKQC